MSYSEYCLQDLARNAGNAFPQFVKIFHKILLTLKRFSKSMLITVLQEEKNEVNDNVHAKIQLLNRWSQLQNWCYTEIYIKRMYRFSIQKLRLMKF